jgi:DNA-binding MarR family transcriptional regulator
MGAEEVPDSRLVIDGGGESSVEDFLAAFDSFTRAVRRARGASGAGAEHPLTLSQYSLLAPLTEKPEARIGELAEEAGITASTATRILDALERRGFVSRIRAPSDRRAVAVKLTPRGRAILRRQDEWVRGLQRSFYGALGPRERELAPELLRRLADFADVLANSG